MIDDERKPVTPKNVYLMFLFILLFYLGGSFALGIVIAVCQIELGIIEQLVITQAIIWCGLLIYMLVSRRNPFISSDFKIKSSFVRSAGTIVLIVLFTMAIYPVVIFLNALSMLFVDNAVSGVLNDMNKKYSLITQLIVIAFVPAVSEELLCRGALMGGLKRHKILGATLISGLFFGILHLNINQFCYAAFLGVMLAILNECTGCIYSSMIVHFLINGVSVVGAYFSKNQSSGVEITKTELLVAIGVYGVLATIGFFFAVGILSIIARINKRKEAFDIIFNNEESKYGNPYAVEGEERKKLLNIWLFIPILVGFGIMILLDFA